MSRAVVDAIGLARVQPCVHGSANLARGIAIRRRQHNGAPPPAAAAGWDGPAIVPAASIPAVHGTTTGFNWHNDARVQHRPLPDAVLPIRHRLQEGGSGPEVQPQRQHDWPGRRVKEVKVGQAQRHQERHSP